MKIAPITLAIIFAALIGVSAQPTTDEFISGKGRLAIHVEGPPNERHDLEMALGEYQLSGETVWWRDPLNNFVELQYYYVYGQNHKPSEADKAKVIDGYKKNWLDELKKAGLDVAENPFQKDGLKGLELRAVGSGRFLARLFFTPTRLVFIAVTRRADSFDPLLTVLDSFRFLPKDEWGQALIAENMPKPLPQRPDFKASASDAQQEGLKGLVQDVFTETQESAKTSREKDSEENFDAHGNLTRMIYYHYGYPSDLCQFGWIDGQRVSADKVIEYGGYEGPNEEQITELTSISPEGGTHKKRDERYSQRYDLKYDRSGALKEKITFNNTGDMALREVHSYSLNRDEKTVFDEKNKLNSRTVSTLDASGNVIEEKKYDDQNKLQSTTIYKYEFDAQGNWTIQRAFTKSGVKLTPGAISYRRIIYYP